MFVDAVLSTRPGRSQAGPLQAVLFVIQPPPGGLEHEADIFLACDKIFVPHFMPSLSSLIFPSEHGRQPLVALAQNFNPSPRSGCAEPARNTPPLVIPEDPRVPAHPRGSQGATKQIPGWRRPPQKALGSPSLSC